MLAIKILEVVGCIGISFIILALLQISWLIILAWWLD